MPKIAPEWQATNFLSALRQFQSTLFSLINTEKIPFFNELEIPGREKSQKITVYTRSTFWKLVDQLLGKLRSEGNF
jgi:hypothetical protein